MTLNRKRILIYLLSTFLITYLFSFLLIIPMATSVEPLQQMIGSSLIVVLMFFPMIGVIITRLLTKEGFNDSYVKLNIKGNIKYYLFAWIGPIALTLLGMLFYFILFPSKLDTEFTTILSQYESIGVVMTKEQVLIKIVAQFFMALLLGPILNFINCFGEEWGWRGYLLPKMLGEMKVLPTLLISGVIWGLWHAPIIAIGHNYGVGYAGFPITGILAMIVFCIVLGIIFSYLTIRTKSCIPAVIGHGAINGFASFSIFFVKGEANPFVGPLPTGGIGGLGFIMVAAILLFKLQKSSQKREEI